MSRRSVPKNEKNLIDYILSVKEDPQRFAAKGSSQNVRNYSAKLLKDMKEHPEQSFSFIPFPQAVQKKQQQLYDLYEDMNNADSRVVQPTGGGKTYLRKEMLETYIRYFADQFLPHHILPAEQGRQSISSHSVALNEYAKHSEEEKDRNSQITTFLRKHMEQSSNFSSLDNSVKVDGELRHVPVMPMRSSFDQVISYNGVNQIRFTKPSYCCDITSFIITADLPNIDQFVIPEELCIKTAPRFYMTLVIAEKPRTSSLLYHDIAVSMYIQQRIREAENDELRLKQLGEDLKAARTLNAKRALREEIVRLRELVLLDEPWKQIKPTLVWTYASFFCGSTLYGEPICSGPSYITTYALKEALCSYDNVLLCRVLVEYCFKRLDSRKKCWKTHLLACLTYLQTMQQISPDFIHGTFTTDSIIVLIDDDEHIQIKVCNFTMSKIGTLDPLPYTMEDKTSSISQTTIRFFTTFLAYGKHEDKYTILQTWYDVFSFLTSVHQCNASILDTFRNDYTQRRKAKQVSKQDWNRFELIMDICCKPKDTRSYFFEKSISSFHNSKLEQLSNIDVTWLIEQLKLA